MALIQKFLLIGYIDQRLLTDVSLSSNGITDEHTCFVVGEHLGTFDTHDLAYEQMKTIEKQPELGFEIKPVFVLEEQKKK